MKAIRLASGALLPYERRPLVMGIVNTTPDSFYPGSRASGEEAVRKAVALVEEGADLLDIGAESSRPGSDYVSEEEELARLVPVVREVRRLVDVPISVDTRKARVAREAIDAGADIVNDISALRDDPDLARLVAERGVPVVLMHMRGTPRTMQIDPHYDDPVEEVRRELLSFVEHALEAGVHRDQIIIDPGFGFGKRREDNLLLLKHLDVFVSTGYPVLVGVSRKSFIGLTLGREVEERLSGTLACHYHAALKGAAILRVHDVKATRDLILMKEAVEGATLPSGPAAES